MKEKLLNNIYKYTSEPGYIYENKKSGHKSKEVICAEKTISYYRKVQDSSDLCQYDSKEQYDACESLHNIYHYLNDNTSDSGVYKQFVRYYKILIDSEYDLKYTKKRYLNLYKELRNLLRDNYL